MTISLLTKSLLTKLDEYYSGAIKPGSVAGIVRIVVLAVLVVLMVSPAAALDIFTLWKQPQVPLSIQEGSWADYKTMVMAGGRRESSITRIACLGPEFGTDENSWIVELLPLAESVDSSMQPIPGEGLVLRISRSLLAREGRLIDAVIEVTQWQGGQASVLSADQWRNDPLVAASFSSEFVPDKLENGQATNRVIDGQQLLCEQFTLSAADTQSVDLPAGRMIQVTTQEVSAAINSELPFLGIAYAAERVQSSSRLDPPSSRMAPPPPSARVETMELTAFGNNAKSHLVMGN